MIKIYKTPCSGPGKSLTLAGYISVLPKITWSQVIYIWVLISLTMISWTPDRAPFFSSSDTLWMIENWKVVDFFVFRGKMCWKISQNNIFKNCDKSNILWWFKIKYSKNNRIFVDQYTIVSNEPMQVYLVIIWIRTILITYRSNIDCRTLKCNKQDPSCSSTS